MAVKFPIIVSFADYNMHDDANDGVCLACGTWSDGGCEPDARNYTCNECGETKVFGAQEAMIMGKIEFSDDK